MLERATKPRPIDVAALLFFLVCVCLIVWFVWFRH
jgi:hypothetical protein